MMISNDIATYGAFIMEGLMDNADSWQRCHEDQGCLETVMAATYILDYAIPLIEKAVALNLEFPGVLDYEVMSAYGTWWRERTLAFCEFPSKEACEAEMLDLICEFFGQGVAGGSAKIHSLWRLGAEMSWKCPKCGSVDLRVNVSAVAVLTQNGDNFETEVLGNHEWGSDSTMLCNECEYVSPSFAFEVNPVCDHLSLDASVPKPPAGYTAEELERDNPYNQWMQES